MKLNQASTFSVFLILALTFLPLSGRGQNYQERVFEDTIDFREATFSKEAYFYKAIFSKEASFSFTTFSQKAYFYNSCYARSKK